MKANDFVEDIVVWADRYECFWWHDDHFRLAPKPIWFDVIDLSAYVPPCMQDGDMGGGSRD